MRLNADRIKHTIGFKCLFGKAKKTSSRRTLRSAVNQLTDSSIVQLKQQWTQIMLLGLVRLRSNVVDIAPPFMGGAFFHVLSRKNPTFFRGLINLRTHLL